MMLEHFPFHNIALLNEGDQLSPPGGTPSQIQNSTARSFGICETGMF